MHGRKTHRSRRPVEPVCSAPWSAPQLAADQPGCFDQILASGFGGVVVADPCAERVNAARQIAHGFRYATCSDQDQDDRKHHDSSERD
jgi:hypothetical protein